MLGDVLCAFSMGLNLLWCGLMGHTVGFAVLAAERLLPVNPRLFFLLGIFAMAVVALAVPGWLRRVDGVLRFVLPPVGVIGTGCFALLHEHVTMQAVVCGALGLFATGVVYFWIVARCILVLTRTRGLGAVVGCLVGAMMVRFAATQIVCSFGNPVLHVVVAMAAPVLASLAFEGVCRALRRAASVVASQKSAGRGWGRRLGTFEGAAGQSEAAGFSMQRTVFGIPQRPRADAGSLRADRIATLLLVLIGAVALVAVRSMSQFGMWGDLDPRLSPVSPWVLGVIVPSVAVMAFGWFALLRTAGYSLVTRFQPALLLTFVGLFAAAVLSSPDGSQMLALVVLVQICESWAHILFWVIVATSLEALGLPSYRAIGLGGAVYAGLSIVWLQLLGQAGATVRLLAAFAAYLLVVGLLWLVWNPLRERSDRGGRQVGTPAGAEAPASASAGVPASASAGELAGVAVGETARADVGIDARTRAGIDPARTMLDRCHDLAGHYALSPREAEVFLLVVQGRSRSFIQEELVLSGSTVKTHVSHIYAKMGVQNRQELMDLVWR